MDGFITNGNYPLELNRYADGMVTLLAIEQLTSPDLGPSQPSGNGNSNPQATVTPTATPTPKVTPTTSDSSSADDSSKTGPGVKNALGKRVIGATDSNGSPLPENRPANAALVRIGYLPDGTTSTLREDREASGIRLASEPANAPGEAPIDGYATHVGAGSGTEVASTDPPEHTADPAPTATPKVAKKKAPAPTPTPSSKGTKKSPTPTPTPTSTASSEKTGLSPEVVAAVRHMTDIYELKNLEESCLTLTATILQADVQKPGLGNRVERDPAAVRLWTYCDTVFRKLDENMYRSAPSPTPTPAGGR